MVSREKELRKYLVPKYTDYLFEIIFTFLFLTVVIEQVVSGTAPGEFGIVLLGYLVLVSYAIFIPLLQYRWMNQVLKDAEIRNQTDHMIIDYQEAVPLCGDRVRAGQDYLFGRDVGAIVRYEEIMKIYGAKGVVRMTSIEVRIRMKDGKTKTLASGIRRKHMQDIAKLIALIYNNNPDLLIGRDGEPIE